MKLFSLIGGGAYPVIVAKIDDTRVVVAELAVFALCKRIARGGRAFSLQDRKLVCLASPRDEGGPFMK